MSTATCDQCGREYQANTTRLRRLPHHFCQYACYAAWRRGRLLEHVRKRVAITCHQCGASCERRPHAVRERNFCSQACVAQWRASGVMAGAHNATWRGGHDEYRGENWPPQRRAARERDGHTCQRCGKHGRNLPVHHKRPFRLFATYLEANELDNLITLCPPCHGIVEMEFWQAHPELTPTGRWPIVKAQRQCRRCEQQFTAEAGRTEVCDACTRYTCAHCGQSFTSRRQGRPIQYCSRGCSNAGRGARGWRNNIRTCEGCGKFFTSQRRDARHCSHECYMVHINPRRSWAAKRSKT